MASLTSTGGWTYVGSTYQCGAAPPTTLEVVGNDLLVRSQPTECWWTDTYEYTPPPGQSGGPTIDDWLSGGGGGGGGGSGEDVWPQEITTFPDSITVQGGPFLPDTGSAPTSPPSCDPADQAKWRIVKAWCTGTPVDSTRMLRLRLAVDTIRLRAGSNCGRLADLLDTALDSAATEVRLFSRNTVVSGQKVYQDYRAGSQAGGTWLAISQEFIDNYHTQKERVADVVTHKWLLLNLQDILVHEADHLDGWSNPNQHTTSLNMAACGSNGAF